MNGLAAKPEKRKSYFGLREEISKDPLVPRVLFPKNPVYPTMPSRLEVLMIPRAPASIPVVLAGRTAVATMTAEEEARKEPKTVAAPITYDQIIKGVKDRDEERAQMAALALRKEKG